MIQDLAAEASDVQRVATVAIVGAGIAGLLLASRLRKMRIHVLVIESGGAEQSDDEHPLNQVEMLGDRYAGAARGRFRCLGGTSTRWGGALIPFLHEDMDVRPHLGLPAWPTSMDAVKRYIPEIETIFKVNDGPYEGRFVHDTGRHVPMDDPEFIARFAKWPAFKLRNVATLLKDEIERDEGLAVWLNATVTDFGFDRSSGRLTSLTARHAGGRTLTVFPDHVVVCAGAIESTRLLLLLDRRYDGRVFDGCEALGGYFFDHISMPLARIEGERAVEVNRLAGIRFTGSNMRTLRFELAPEVQALERVASAYGHISFESNRPGGFEALREFFRTLQRKGRPGFEQALAVLKDTPFLFGLVYWRLVHGQLRWPDHATHLLHVAAEQLPHDRNRITLSSDTDVYGLPRAAIDWKVRDADRLVFSAYARRFDQFWHRHSLDKIGQLRWEPVSAGNDSEKVTGADTFHPGGTTRMGLDGRNAVVDLNLQSFAVRNLSVASTSTFPTGASANPTLMLMLFALRLADHLGAHYAAR